MRFKTQKINNEYNELHIHNIKLKKALITLDTYCEAEFGKDICITELLRTQEEHDKLYAATEPAKRPKTSPHMLWRAADVRSTDFTSAQKEKMLDLILLFSYKSGSGRASGLLHTIAGNVQHFHIQID